MHARQVSSDSPTRALEKTPRVFNIVLLGAPSPPTLDPPRCTSDTHPRACCGTSRGTPLLCIDLSMPWSLPGHLAGNRPLRPHSPSCLTTFGFHV